MPKTVVTFGEIMLRLTPPGFLRLTQATTFDVVYGGSEANVAVSLAHFGQPTEFVTALPSNDIGEACLSFLRQHGVGTKHILRHGNRLGVYFLERGAAARSSKVIYDRAGSSFADLGPGMVDWPAVFAGADWFHWSGINPALTPGLAELCHEAGTTARIMGLNVSCDLNYRKNLWQWGRQPVEVMPALATQCDVIIGNVETVETMFGIPAPGSDGDPAAAVAQARAVAERLAERLPRVSTIALTVRGSHSASHNVWSSVLWRRDAFCVSPTYDLNPIVERVGGGDAFTAGLIYGLRRTPVDLDYALRFAAAAAALKHTIPGDSNLVTVAEVEQVMSGDTSGRISR